eukprot:CAMPEP_0201646206 /NCGR_PEP_ID=MMETSP0493-20130528/33491_1 /ASSEMBLY_ACC=CAM_ASM_000838 /TAXON_ID=420259 /ORGANISM="Thalassiosira gravida, Strain GMp14c1" /LENGTH=106 /DNA_ID=CAMNT_0048121319 /DNA_START=597 /DNA_END=916 /DNA_ORIENTATION=-
MYFSMFLLASMQVLGRYFRKSNVTATPLGSDANATNENEESLVENGQHKDEIVTNESSIGVIPASNNENKAAISIEIEALTDVGVNASSIWTHPILLESLANARRD